MLLASRTSQYLLCTVSYPDQNCAAEFPNGGFGDIKDPQAVFPNYLTHASGVQMVQPYLNSAGIAQQLGKEFMMFETNTASCGGFPGVSDSFASALWAVDYGLQMAYSNFTGALLHVGGQNVSYNVSFASFYPVVSRCSLALMRSRLLVSACIYYAVFSSNGPRAEGRLGQPLRRICPYSRSGPSAR